MVVSPLSSGSFSLQISRLKPTERSSPKDIAQQCCEFYILGARRGLNLNHTESMRCRGMIWVRKAAGSDPVEGPRLRDLPKKLKTC